MYVRESAGEITSVIYILNRLMYTQNRVLLCFSQVEYSIFSVYHIQCLIGVIKRVTDPASEDGGKRSFTQSLR